MNQLRGLREQILALAGRRGAQAVRVFGSVARAEADAGSDVDFVVEMQPGRSLLDLAGFATDMEQLLGVHVDVVTEKGIRAAIRERVLREAVSL